MSLNDKIVSKRRVKVGENRTYVRRGGSERERGVKAVSSTLKKGGLQRESGKQEELPMGKKEKA